MKESQVSWNSLLETYSPIKSVETSQQFQVAIEVNLFMSVVAVRGEESNRSINNCWDTTMVSSLT